MNDWKNPSFGKRNDASNWNPPFIEEFEEKGNAMNSISLGIFLRAVIGFMAVVGINALALFGVAYFLRHDLSYRDATIVAGIYVIWRIYDKQVFDRFQQ